MRTGEQLNVYYRAALKTLHLTREEVAATMVDLKRRINGDFHVIEQDEEKIVLGNGHARSAPRSRIGRACA